MNGMSGGAAPPRKKNTVGIVLAIGAGCLVLFVILGILAAIAIPNFVTATQRSKQKRTMADLRTVATALEAYATDKNEYPHATSVAELATALSPTYIRTLPSLDGWGNAMKYDCWPAEGPCEKYALGSAGSDKAWEHESLQEYANATTDRFESDIVFANGAFLQYPEGIQGQ
jgi:general secretion pathway protein G